MDQRDRRRNSVWLAELIIKKITMVHNFWIIIYVKRLLLITLLSSSIPYRLRFKNVKHSDRGRYSCLISGFTDNGMFSKWRNFTLITYKRSEATGNGKSLKMTAPLSLSHRKDGAKPKFINRLFMDNNVALLVNDVLTLSCPFESKKFVYFLLNYNTINHI